MLASPAARMHRNPLVIVMLLAVLAGAAALVIAVALEPGAREAPPTQTPRIVSLMPPITETLYEIGAGDYLVGRSEYCVYPPEAVSLPSCGTALMPNTEAIVRLEPTLIIGNDSKATAREKLRGLGNAEFVPWLTAEEVIAGTRHLGVLSGKEAAANELADELARVLLVPEPQDGPRVLLAMSHTPGQMAGVTFLRRNSLHGRVLNAAGGRNAVDQDVSGVPTLSIEEVLAIDPDIIIVLAFAHDLHEDERAGIIADWQRLSPLKAVQHGRVGLLEGKQLVPAARRTFMLVDALRQEITRLGR